MISLCVMSSCFHLWCQWWTPTSLPPPTTSLSPAGWSYRYKYSIYIIYMAVSSLAGVCARPVPKFSRGVNTHSGHRFELQPPEHTRHSGMCQGCFADHVRSYACRVACVWHIAGTYRAHTWHINLGAHGHAVQIHETCPTQNSIRSFGT